MTFYKLPRIVLSNMSIFKNFQLGGGRRIQFRWEAYNVFNQVNWSALNTNAQFNPAGEQVNASFGQATASRSARVMQGAIGSPSKPRFVKGPRTTRIHQATDNTDNTAWINRAVRPTRVICVIRGCIELCDRVPWL